MTFKAKLTLFNSHLELVTTCDTLSALQMIQMTELKLRLTKIEDLCPDYDSIHSDIENYSDIPEQQCKGRVSYETQ